MSLSYEQKRAIIRLVINLFVIMVTISTVLTAKYFVDDEGNEIEQPLFIQALWWIGFCISLKIWIPVIRWLINEWFSWKVAARIARWIDEKKG